MRPARSCSAYSNTFWGKRVCVRAKQRVSVGERERERGKAVERERERERCERISPARSCFAYSNTFSRVCDNLDDLKQHEKECKTEH